MFRLLIQSLPLLKIPGNIKIYLSLNDHHNTSMRALKDLESKLKWDIFWVGLIQVANYIFPFITTTYLINTIGVGLFGKTEFATLLVLYFITLTNYEFHISGTRRISIIKDDPVKISAAFSEILTTKIYLFLVSSLLFTILVLAWPARFANWLI